MVIETAYVGILNWAVHNIKLANTRFQVKETANIKIDFVYAQLSASFCLK